jgi:hypothetical protein
MKKNDLILILSAFIFSGLFYEQEGGINFLLFSLLMTVVLLIYNPEKLSDKKWWLYALCANLAGLAVFTVNSDLSFMAFTPAMIVLAGKTCFPDNSIIVNGFFAAYTFARTPLDIAINTWKYYNNREDSKKENSKKLVLGITIALVIAILFLLLYRKANPLFNQFTKDINLEWVNGGRILFTLFGLVIIYALLHNKKIDDIDAADKKWQRDEQPSGQAGQGISDSTTIIAITLFVILNIMLLIMNFLDITNIYATKTLPAGITLSQFVHDAVFSTVVSIVFAVALIAWLFMGDLNFSREGKWVRLLVYAWILQTLLVVINTMVRNTWYIREFQLTHQRIGVFVFLILCVFGLLFTYFKIKGHKSAWWLAGINFHSWFLILVSASLINWDKHITTFNINNSTGTKKLDKEYLLKLSEANLPQLRQLYEEGRFTKKETRLFFKKLLRAYKRNRFQQWPSYSLRIQESNRVFTEIKI